MFDRLAFEVWLFYHRKFRPLKRANATPEEIKFYKLLTDHTLLRMNKHLLRQALKYDIDLTDDPSIFQHEEAHNLTIHGRSVIRRRVHEEKERRFEAVARWVKLFAPLIASLTGLLGIITGLVAVIHRKP
jgi:hypothetical protein